MKQRLPDNVRAGWQPWFVWVKNLPVKKTEAIVLGYYPLGESDRIVSFHTRELGLVRAVAKGARKASSRFSGRLEILTYGNLIFFERANKDLHYVNAFDVIEQFQSLRDDLLKMAYSSYLAELMQQVESPGVTEGKAFELLLKTMFMMRTAGDPELLTRAFEIKLFAAAGLKPHLDSCVRCSRSFSRISDQERYAGSSIKLDFDVAAGGVVCHECAAILLQEPDPAQKTVLVTISRGTFELMKRMQEKPLEYITRLRMLESSRRELKKLTRAFITYHLDGKRFRSLDFLESMEKDRELLASR